MQRSQRNQWSLILSCVFIFKIVCSQLLGSLSLILKYIFPTVPCSAQLASPGPGGLITARRSDETVSALKTLLAPPVQLEHMTDLREIKERSAGHSSAERDDKISDRWPLHWTIHYSD